MAEVVFRSSRGLQFQVFEIFVSTNFGLLDETSKSMDNSEAVGNLKKNVCKVGLGLDLTVLAFDISLGSSF